jgi:DNA-binding transcriptional LysR family regulator
MTTDALDLGGLLRALAVSEAGSFAAAARALGISRQAVHRSVEALEAACGGPIFDRGGQQLRPTSLGRELLRHAEALRALERSVRASLVQAEPAGSVRLTAPPLFSETVLAEALVSFARAWPAVSVHVRSESKRTNLIRDDYDLMIRVGAPPPEEHHAQRLGHMGVILCASPDLLARVGAPDTPDALARYALLEYGARGSTRWTFSAAGEERTVAAAPQLVADAAEIVSRACLAGLGVLRIPEIAVAARLASGQLVRVLRGWELPRAEVWAVYGHRTADDPTLRAITHELRLAFERLG